MAVPVGEKVEIEFTAGVWTDVTSDVDWSQGVAMSRGRTSPNGDPQTGTFTCKLRNSTGKYTPGTGVLKDGTAHTYYPNVQIRRRLRYSWTVSAVQKVRFLGFIKGWPPLLENGILAYVQLTASDRLDLLGRVRLDGAILNGAIADGAVVAYTFGDDDSATEPAPAIAGLNTLPVRQQGVGGLATFGVPGPDDEQTTAVELANVDVSNGVFFAGPTGYLAATQAYTVEAWFRTDVTPVGNNGNVAHAFDPVRGVSAAISVGTSGLVAFAASGVGSGITGGSDVTDGLWHQAVVTCTTAGSVTGYVDGASVGTGSAGVLTYAFTELWVAQSSPAAFATSVFTGAVGGVFQYSKALTAAQVLKHYNARMGVVGEKTGQRITRYLTYAGLGGSEYDVDDGQVTVGEHSLLDSDAKVAGAARDLAATESGGAAFYVLPTGVVRYADSSYRLAASPVITFDAQNDLVYPGWQPAWDDSTLVNHSTVTRSGGLPVTYVNAASDAAYLESGDIGSSQVFSDTDQAALNVAAYRVNSQAQPGFRLPTFQVNLVTATTAGLYGAWANVQIGSRIRITNIPPGVTNGTQADVIFEGCRESSAKPNGEHGYLLSIDASPADTPGWGIWDDADYGHWQPDLGALTLNASITKTATALAVATASPTPTLSTSAGDYPVEIWVGTEKLRLGTPPSGSVSPQSFTGVTRGVDGTFAFAHTAGDVVTHAPGSTWAPG